MLIRRHLPAIWPLIYYSALIVFANHSNRNFCPNPNLHPGCLCRDGGDDGIVLECSKIDSRSLFRILENVSSPVASLNLVHFDEGVKALNRGLFPVPSEINRIRFVRSDVEEIVGEPFDGAGGSIAAIAIVSSNLKAIPGRAFRNLKSLKSLDLEWNRIQEIPGHGFHGLRLTELNVKGNLVEEMSEFSFAGLEATLKELNLAENRLKSFPVSSLKLLTRLTSVRLAWNDISEIFDDGRTKLSSIQYLDLSSNDFEIVPSNCFRPFPSLTFLSLRRNSIEIVREDGFASLVSLEYLDLSRNRISSLDPSVFRFNRKIAKIDLSGNRIRRIAATFTRLPNLRHVYLTGNDIAEVRGDAFADSTSLESMHLDGNSIRRIDPGCLRTLPNLMEVRVGSNSIARLPNGLFEACLELDSVRLNDNEIDLLEPGLFGNRIDLREIDLKNNRLEKIDGEVFRELSMAVELNLENNAIETIGSRFRPSTSRLDQVNVEGNASISPEVASELRENVQILRLARNRISRLSRDALRHLPNLIRLYLSENAISEIEDDSFAQTRFLQVLDLGRNRLRSIARNAFAHLEELQELNLAENLIEYVEPFAFDHLKKIRFFDCGGNRVKKMGVDVFREGLPVRRIRLNDCQIGKMERKTFGRLLELTEIDLAGNEIDFDSLTRLEMPNLKILKASRNLFGRAPATGSSLKGFPFLETLTLDNSSLRRLPENLLSENGRMKIFSSSGNGLEEIPVTIFRETRRMEEIKLSGNFLTEIPHASIADLKNLKVLDLSENFISSVDFSKLNGITRIRILNLSGNKIAFLAGFSAIDFPELSQIFLNRNVIAHFPADFFAVLPDLKNLDLSENRLSRMTKSPISGSLKRLDLTGNPISRLGDVAFLGKFPSLEEIRIGTANLSGVDSNDLKAFPPRLLHLDLSENAISGISPDAFRSLPRLLTLNLSRNELTEFPRFRGLIRLAKLNLSENRLSRVEEFPPDLSATKILDLSFNELKSIERKSFVHLVNLEELRLTGNRISFIAHDSFRSLKKMTVLNLSKNCMENLPLRAFRWLENRIRSLRIEGNPIRCGCDQQEVWEWLRDHRKLMGSTAREIRCEDPFELRGFSFVELPPTTFCPIPLLLKLAIQDVQPFSFVVTWQSRNHSGWHGYGIEYTDLEANKSIRLEILDRNVRSLRLNKLESDTKYLVCIVGLGTWNATKARERHETNIEFVLDESEGKCTEVKTLQTPEIAYGKGSGERWDSSNSFLTRRLGLMVGTCLGSIVFIVLVSILAYMKIQKQRRVCNGHRPLPPDYFSYRHFPIHNGDGTSAGHVIGASITYF